MPRPRLPMAQRKPPGAVTTFKAPPVLKREFLSALDPIGVPREWVFVAVMAAVARDPDRTLAFLREAKKPKEA